MGRNALGANHPRLPAPGMPDPGVGSRADLAARPPAPRPAHRTVPGTPENEKGYLPFSAGVWVMAAAAAA